METRASDLECRLGEILKKHREEMKMSITEVAGWCGVSRSTILSIETGSASSHFNNVIQYAYCLGKTAFDEFMTEISREAQIRTYVRH